jgi:geranylgeranyl diphosphate synthase, type II
VTETHTFDLPTYLEEERRAVEDALERALFALEPQLPPKVGAAVRHGVTTGGKRLRPVLCATAYRACRGSGDRASVYDLAVSLELVHAYSLMHDDLPCMDDAELRRGSPTTHRAHGESTAVLAGAVLIPAAALQAVRAAEALGCSRDASVAVARTLLEASGAGGMVGGQWLDLLGEGQALDGQDLDRLHGRKTGALLAAALVMGGLAAGARRPVLEALHTYGTGIGLAFQIADDVLDATSSAEILGKNPSDAALEKSTYVSLHGLDAARQRAREIVSAALEALDAARVDAPALTGLAHYVVERDR